MTSDYQVGHNEAQDADLTLVDRLSLPVVVPRLVGLVRLLNVLLRPVGELVSKRTLRQRPRGREGWSSKDAHLLAKQGNRFGELT